MKKIPADTASVLGVTESMGTAPYSSYFLSSSSPVVASSPISPTSAAGHVERGVPTSVPISYHRRPRRRPRAPSSQPQLPSVWGVGPDQHRARMWLRSASATDAWGWWAVASKTCHKAQAFVLPRTAPRKAGGSSSRPPEVVGWLCSSALLRLLHQPPPSRRISPSCRSRIRTREESGGERSRTESHIDTYWFFYRSSGFFDVRSLHRFFYIPQFCNHHDLKTYYFTY
jgi:hypothetical protein